MPQSFFPAYCGIVLLSAALCQKLFVVRPPHLPVGLRCWLAAAPSLSCHACLQLLLCASPPPVQQSLCCLQLPCCMLLALRCRNVQAEAGLSHAKRHGKAGLDLLAQPFWLLACRRTRRCRRYPAASPRP